MSITAEQLISQYESLVDAIDEDGRQDVHNRILDDKTLSMPQAYRLLCRLAARFSEEKTGPEYEPEINNHAAFVARHLPRRRMEG